MDRIGILCSYLEPCIGFADVACDHGYCAEYMLKNALCDFAVVSDISEKSLSKAKSLLSAYIENGTCRAVCCDGLTGIDRSTEQVMIAGIGGEEIVKILINSYIPKKFVFQPMKNDEVLRAYLLKNNCDIVKDELFTDGKKYYFVIKGRRDGVPQAYTKAQLIYGRDSINNGVFPNYLREELEKKKSYLNVAMADASRRKIENDIAFIEGVLSGEIK